MNDSVTVFPDPGEHAEIAALLLELADNPRDVATTLDPGLGFTVPTWLFDKFVEVWDVRNGADPTARKGFDADKFAAELAAELAADGKDTTELDKFIVARMETEAAIASMETKPADETPETPARRKPGRPRKES